MRNLRELVLALVLTLASASGAAAQSEAAADPVVLTVYGDVAKPNRGALDEFADALLHGNSLSFEKAHAFTRAELAALPQQAVTAEAEGWSAPVKLAGPRLRDVLAAAGVTSQNLAFTALDGYTIEFEPGEMAAQAWILAIDADGKPLGIGGRGPAWLAFDTAGKKASADQEARWIYAIFAIAAR